MAKVKIGILANELINDHQPWVEACEKKKEDVDFKIINLTKDNWLDEVQADRFDILLTKPGGISSRFKQLYDERVYLLKNAMGFRLYPDDEEVYIYENKRFLYSWLASHHIPLPQTRIFYDLNDALDYLETSEYPVVAKLNIGASGKGVSILKNKSEAVSYTRRAFWKGISAKSGPNWDKDSPLTKIVNLISRPALLLEKKRIYSLQRSEIQQGYVLFQEFINHTFEWRVVRIGDSFFAHKKLKKGDKASGSLLKDYSDPPADLIDFVYEITERFHFYSQAVDIFEPSKGHYIVNEMQCIFGQSDPYQMKVGGVPGRYIRRSGQWIFEPGDFNSLMGYLLRLEHVINILNIND